MPVQFAHLTVEWPKKSRYTPGRPKQTSPQAAITHIRTIAPKSFFQREVITVDTDFFSCPICLEIVDRPIELTECSSLVCSDCLCQWLRVSQSVACPCCYTVHLDKHSSIKAASGITLKALGSTEVRCNLCLKRGHLQYHREHVEGRCSGDKFKQVAVDASELISRPRDQPLSPLEEELQSTLISRSLRSSQTVQVKTRGQVSMTCHTTILATILITYYVYK